MLCRVTSDARDQNPPPYDNEHDEDSPLRNDPPVILLPESQEDVSGDSQTSDGFVASSLPAQEAAHPPEPSSPPPEPSSPPPGMPVQAEDDHLSRISPITPLSYDESSSDEEPPRTRNYLQLTDTVTGSRKRIYYDNNFNRL